MLFIMMLRYSFSTTTMGPRKIGYDSCEHRGCLRTETVGQKFSKCSSCRVPFYCSRDCQAADWKARHKKVQFEVYGAVKRSGLLSHTLEANCKLLFLSLTLPRVHFFLPFSVPLLLLRVQVCKAIAQDRERMSRVGKMMQKLSDVSLAGSDGQDGDIGDGGGAFASLLQAMQQGGGLGGLQPDAADAVARRRAHLKAEKKREKKP